ncbi:unnamed protein product [Urochloa humidicola]
MRDEVGREGEGSAPRRRELGQPRPGRSSACRSGLVPEVPPQIERVAGYRTVPVPSSPSSRSALVAAAAVSPGTSVTSSMDPGCEPLLHPLLTISFASSPFLLIPLCFIFFITFEMRQRLCCGKLG